MKKLLIALLAISSLALTGCNNDIGFGSYSFHKVHVQMYGGPTTHFEVDNWKDDEGGVEIKTKKHGTIILGDGTYMLYDTDNCPICGSVTYK